MICTDIHCTIEYSAIAIECHSQLQYNNLLAIMCFYLFYESKSTALFILKKEQKFGQYNNYACYMLPWLPWYWLITLLPWLPWYDMLPWYVLDYSSIPWRVLYNFPSRAPDSSYTIHTIIASYQLAMHWTVDIRFYSCIGSLVLC